jgi:hypothetical protein
MGMVILTGILVLYVTIMGVFCIALFIQQARVTKRHADRCSLECCAYDSNDDEGCV